MNIQEATALFRAHQSKLEQSGAILHGVKAYLPDDFRYDYNLALAMDAQPALSTDPNSAVPAFLTTLIDPEVYKILFAPNKAVTILGEVKKGSWLDDTVMFPVVEHVGEVSSYGDFAENGHAGANTNWPQRQSYVFQTIEEYGDRELERAGLARINWVSELDQAAATVINKFQNYSYFFGVQGLQNYGLLNDPGLPASITPAPKAWGGVKWVNNGVIVATANEIYSDIQSLVYQLATQTQGLVDAESKMVLAMAPGIAIALNQTNSFNVNVKTLLKDNFPNLRIETAVQYGQTSATNNQGLAAGNLVQLIAETIEGQDTGYCAFNEKMRSFPIIRAMSSYKKKVVGGTWGAILRMPVAFASMLGV